MNASRVHSSRIEQAKENVERLREELRAEVAQEVQANLRRRRWRDAFTRCGGCCTAYLLALVVLAGGLGYLAARSGVVTVPVLSARVVGARAPMRIVVPRAFNLAGRLSVPTSERMEVTMTEEELTGLLRTSVAASAGVQDAIRETIQAAITPDSIELFAEVAGVGGARSTLLLRVQPTVSASGSLELTVREAALGNLGVPSTLLTMLLRQAIERSATSYADAPFTLRAVELGDRQVTIALLRRDTTAP